jgi:hypothetical protein
MASKTFRVAVGKEPVEFTLEYLIKGKPTSMVFHCRPAVPVGILMEFAAVGGSDPEDEKANARAMELIQDIFRVAIVEDEINEWERLTREPDVAIDVELYSEIASWLAEQYTARPTGASSSGTAPAGSHGTGSTDGASAEVLTYSRPEHPALAR